MALGYRIFGRPHEVEPPVKNFVMHHVSEEQLQKAKILAERIKATLAVRETRVANNSLNAEFALPNFEWERVGKYTRFFVPTRELLEELRLHTTGFFGNFLVKNGLGKAPLPLKLKVKYKYLTVGVPEGVIFRPPEACSEFGWRYGGGIVNVDSLMYQSHITTLYRHGVIDYLRSLPSLTILEIGGGYGPLAYFFKELFPQARYYAVDIPESLLFQAYYLLLVKGECVDVERSVYDGSDPILLSPERNTYTFIPNFLAHDLIGNASFDFVINTASLGEMNETQVEEYAKIVFKTLKPAGIFFEENSAVISPAEKIIRRHFQHGETMWLQKRIWVHDKNVFEQLASLRRDRGLGTPLWVRALDRAIALKWRMVEAYSWMRKKAYLCIA